MKVVWDVYRLKEKKKKVDSCRHLISQLAFNQLVVLQICDTKQILMF